MHSSSRRHRGDRHRAPCAPRARPWRYGPATRAPWPRSRPGARPRHSWSRAVCGRPRASRHPAARAATGRVRAVRPCVPAPCRQRRRSSQFGFRQANVGIDATSTFGAQRVLQFPSVQRERGEPREQPFALRRRRCVGGRRQWHRVEPAAQTARLESRAEQQRFGGTAIAATRIAVVHQQTDQADLRIALAGEKQRALLEIEDIGARALGRRDRVTVGGLGLGGTPLRAHASARSVCASICCTGASQSDASAASACRCACAALPRCSSPRPSSTRARSRRFLRSRSPLASKASWAAANAASGAPLRRRMRAARTRPRRRVAVAPCRSAPPRRRVRSSVAPRTRPSSSCASARRVRRRNGFIGAIQARDEFECALLQVGRSVRFRPASAARRPGCAVRAPDRACRPRRRTRRARNRAPHPTGGRVRAPPARDC